MPLSPTQPVQRSMGLTYPHEHAIKPCELAIRYLTLLRWSPAATASGRLSAGDGDHYLAGGCWNPAEVAAINSGFIYRLLWNKWYFDELYQAVFVEPVMFLARRASDIDLRVIDRSP